jgi:hypothetical protein
MESVSVLWCIVAVGWYEPVVVDILDDTFDDNLVDHQCALSYSRLVTARQDLTP